MHVDGWAGEQKGRRSVSSYLTEEALLAEPVRTGARSSSRGGQAGVMTIYWYLLSIRTTCVGTRTPGGGRGTRAAAKNGHFCQL